MSAGIPGLSSARRLWRSLREMRAWRAEIARWKAAQSAIQPSITLPADGSVQRLLLVVGDPWTFAGSLGDHAMIDAVTRRLRERNPDLVAATIVATPAGGARALELGFEPLAPLWEDPFPNPAMIDAITEFAPDLVLVLGADVMDGYYSPFTSMRLLAVADLAARMGARATILGFSFNATPSPMLAEAYAMAHESVRLNLRDPLSLDRFQRFADGKGQLVADSAFMLKPAEDLSFAPELDQWIAAQHAQDRLVIGFNVHPMLFREITPDQIDALVGNCSDALIEVGKSKPVSWLLIPHDHRTGDGDNRCLGPIAKRVGEALGGAVHHAAAPLLPGQIKALVGAIDGVVSARMHLIIATLGTGTPIAAITYQDKFAGLMEHFGLPPSILLSPAELESGGLPDHLRRFIDQVGELRAQVGSRLSAVKAMSAANLPAEPD